MGSEMGAGTTGFGFGLFLGAFLFGLRHGIDWDHIAAIADITSSQDDRARTFWYGTLYALGHAAVVFGLGVVAIAFGDLLPEGVDEMMGRVVGVTLLVLGVYVFVSLVRHGRDFRLRSRWMLVFSGVRKAVRWARARAGSAPEPAAQPATLGAAAAADPTLWHHGHHGRPGHHHHPEPAQDEPFVNYTVATSVGVGVIHGVGAETPSQVLIFLAATGAGGVGVGLTVLAAFVVGLLASNSLITVGSAYGFLSASRNFALYAAVGIIVGLFSLALGTLFVLGRESVLPAFFGA